jgi:MFS family permease
MAVEATSSRAVPVGSAAFVALFVLAYAGTWIAVQAPVLVSLPLRVEQIAPGHPAETLSLVLGLGSLVAFGSPFFGRLSDRTSSRFGRRRPWLLGGAALGLLGAIILSVAPSAGALTVGWCLVKLGCGISLAALLAVLAEFVVTGRRGSVAGLLGICPPIGAAAGAWLVNIFQDSRALMFLAPALFAVAAALAFVAFMPEGPAAAERPPMWRGLLVNVRRHPDFGWAWLSRFLFFLAVGSIVSYQALYLRHQLGRPLSDIPELIAFATLVKTIVVVAASLVMGRVSDRIGRRKPFVFGAALLFAAGPVVIVASGTYSGFVVGLAIVGLALGTYAPVDLALVIDVLPNRGAEAGKDLGILNLATTLPGSVAPAIAPLLLIGGSYTPLFLGSGALCGAAGVVNKPITAYAY